MNEDTPVALLAAVAGEFGALATLIDAATLELAIDLARFDGRVVKYAITAESNGSKVRARESRPLHLPAFCPERHINADGSFCLYWEGEDALDVVDEPSARVWWETLYRFLLDQERAAKLGRWPTTDGWAHGNAARFQQRAIAAAARLGDRFVQALRDRRLTVVKRRRHGSNADSTLDVLLHGRHVFSVWSLRQRVVNKKQRCFCQSDSPRRPKRLGRCRTHADDARDLAVALARWDEAEIEFWRIAAHMPCCGTCKSCPLKQALSGQSQQDSA